MDLTELTALEPSAVEPMDHMMDHQELHAQEKSQLQSLTTIPSQLPDKDMEILETKPHNTHLLLTQ